MFSEGKKEERVFVELNEEDFEDFKSNFYKNKLKIENDEMKENKLESVVILYLKMMEWVKKIVKK